MRHLRFMLTFGFQNSDRTFFLTAKAVYILSVTLLFVAFLLHRLSVLFSQFNFELHQRHLYCCTLASENIFRTLPLLFRAVIGSTAPILLHFNLEKRHPFFPFRFLTTVDLFYLLLLGFSTLNIYTVCLFVCLQSRKIRLLHFRKNFKIDLKTSRIRFLYSARL